MKRVDENNYLFKRLTNRIEAVLRLRRSRRYSMLLFAFVFAHNRNRDTSGSLREAVCLKIVKINLDLISVGIN